MPDAPIIDWEGGAREVTRGVIQGIFDWIRARLTRKREPAPPGSADAAGSILLIGPGGTGKTTLAHLLSGNYNWLLDSPWEYTQSLDIEHVPLGDDPGVELVVPPGQQFRRDFAWPDLLRDLANGVYRGVILTACYGYHSLTVPSYKAHTRYTGTKDEFLSAFLEDRRAEELRVFRQLVPHLSVCPNPIWLLVVVVKQDLWASQRREVEQHYTSGDFAREVEQVARTLGGRFRSEVVFTSLLISNFDTERGERLKPNEAGYDHRMQILSLRKLFDTLAALKSWEGRA